MSDFARQFVASTAAIILPARGNSLKSSLARQYLPYCVSQIGQNGECILLNREYKPLGWPTRRRGFVDYSDPQFDSMKLPVDANDLLGLPHRTTENGTFFYLYGPDGVPAPWESIEAAARYIATLCRIIDAPALTREGVSA